MIARWVLLSLCLVLVPTTVVSAEDAAAVLTGATVLFQGKLWDGARQELQQAIASSPDEAALRLLLAHVYERTGLRLLAAPELARAKALGPARE